MKYLNPFLVLLHQDIHTRKEALDILIEKMHEIHPLKADIQDLKDQIDRFGYHNGMVFGKYIYASIFRSEKMTELCIGICVPKHPVIIDNEMVSMVILVLTGAKVNQSYVNMMTELLEISENSGSVLSLLRSKTGEEFIRCLREQESLLEFNG